MSNLNVKWLVALSCQIRGGKWLTFSKHLTKWPFAAEWLSTFCVQSGWTQSCVLMTSPCWEGRILLRQPSWGIEGVVSNPECSEKEQREEASHLWRTFSEKELTEHPRRTVAPMQERGGPRHPQGGLGIFEEEVCALTLLTRWANCVTIFKCQGHGLLSCYCYVNAGLLK